MRANAKSEWTPMCCETERDRDALKSWFSPLCDDMTPLKADILCDIATDREKKLRATMRDKDGRERIAVRTKTARGWTISLRFARPSKSTADKVSP